ncbi:MAG: DUF4388 domain-containing protein [Deltaproteobacteria bacterium]|nr:DUF4388 domain-containing protein [Deltaproteobacteria bacterium]
MTRVLVVSPREAWAGATTAALQGDGLSVRHMPTGELAIDAFVQEPADALIVELELPGRDGAATVESIRWAPGGDRALVILVGANADPERVRRVALELRARSAPDGNLGSLRSALASLMTPTEDQPLTGEITKQVSSEELIEQTRAPTKESDVRMPEAAIAPAVTALLNPEDEATRDTAETAAMADDAHGDDAEGREVEERAKVLEEVARIEGDLAETSFARTLARLGELRATGALLLSSKGDPRPTTTKESPKKVVFFRNGIPLHVRSNLVSECLGQVLARQGWIDNATLEDSLAKVRAGGGKQGVILVAMGALKPRQLRSALELEQQEKLFDLFTWPTGSFRFSEAMSPPGETVTLEMSMAEMVVRGIARVPAPRVVDALTDQAERYPRPQAVRMGGLRRAVDPPAKALLDAVDGRTTTRDLLQRSTNRTDGARALHAAACLGAVTFHDEPLEVPAEQIVSGQFDLTSEVRRLAMLLRDGQYAMALRVTQGDSDAASKAAGKLERAIRTGLEEELASPDLQAAAFEVLSRLPRAALAVGGDFERSSIPPPPMAAAPPRHETAQLPSDWGDDVTETSVAEVLPSDDDDEGPSTTEFPTLPERDAEAEAQARADAAFVAKAKAAAAEQEAAEAELAAKQEAAAKAEAEAREDAERQAQLDARVERMLRAERFFRRGCRALGRDARDQALEAFEEAVALAPDEGEFLMHLGWSRVLAEGGDTDAGIGELRKAASMVPKMEQVHLWLARALRDSGDTAGARDAYGDALAVNPDSSDALEELRALGT